MACLKAAIMPAAVELDARVRSEIDRIRGK